MFESLLHTNLTGPHCVTLDCVACCVCLVEVADVIKAAAHCSHRRVQPAPKYFFFNTDAKVYIWATLAHKVVWLSWTLTMMFSTTALPVIWPCSLGLWNTSVLSFQCFILISSCLQMAILKCCPHLAMTDSLRAWQEAFPHVFPFYGVSSRHPRFPLLLWVFFFSVCNSPPSHHEERLRIQSLPLRCTWSLFSIRLQACVCKLLFACCVCDTQSVCVRERERLSHAWNWLPEAHRRSGHDVYKSLPMCPHKFTCWTVATHFFFFNTPPCAKFSLSYFGRTHTFAMSRTRGEITQSREWCHTSICACVVVESALMLPCVDLTTPRPLTA